MHVMHETVPSDEEEVYDHTTLIYPSYFPRSTALHAKKKLPINVNKPFFTQPQSRVFETFHDIGD